MAFDAGALRKDGGGFTVFIPPTEKNMRLLDKNINDFSRSANSWNGHTRIGFVSGIALMVCTISLIACAVDGCFDSGEDAILCGNICSEPARITAIVGEVISGIGVIIACCIGMNR